MKSSRGPGIFSIWLWVAVVFGIVHAGAAQTPAPQEDGGMTPEQIEFQKKLGAATAAAQKDPAIQAAYQKLAKTMRELDDLLYGKIKQIDPSLKEHVDKLLKAKYPDSGQGK